MPSGTGAWVFAVLLLATRSSCMSTADQEEVSCDSTSSCDSNAAPASLLQKVFKHEGKTTIDQSPSQPDQSPSQLDAALCTGIRAQGKCWYLSEIGESCAQTCSKFGQGFSFVVANDVTPRLVGHEPATKQAPWASLECYVPGEDRYHTANVNAAKHTEDIGSWSHESCKLACPCSGTGVTTDGDPTLCSWKQPPACADEWNYKGSTYSGCAVVDSSHDKPWCQHHYQHDESGPGAPEDWSYCEYSCAPDTVPAKEDGCSWRPSFSCVQEFDYEGTHYVGCTDKDHDTPWCSNSLIYEGSWNHCIYTCAEHSEKVDEINRDARTNDEMCYWQPREDCERTFEFKGIQYTGCTTTDHPTPWCSHDRKHKGSWATCAKICNGPSGQTTPVPPAPAPVPTDEEPCARHPEADNDVIGTSVTLDEAGYRIAAAANSPINMKRFVCRVVSKIGCKVTDLPSLMGFVPYYSGLESHQTYKHLESELTTICHQGGKWVMPAE